MAEAASNITRIHPEGAPADVFIFEADTEPPRFAWVTFGEEPCCWVEGPLTREQLDISIEVGDGIMTEEQQKVTEDSSAVGYALDLIDVGYHGEYPGGREKMALNMARVALAAE